MSRFAHLLGAYLGPVWRKQRSLSVREFASGSGILAEAEASPAELLQDAGEVLLLVHGYNVPVSGAEQVYACFRGNLDDRHRETAIGVFWPGDMLPRASEPVADPSGVSLILSALNYPEMLDMAKQSARRLSRAIVAELNRRDDMAAERQGRAEPLRLLIVAHSLGCRVALEMLDDLRNRSPRELTVPLAAFMAAAVPMYHVQAEGDLEDALLKPESVLLYTSWRDLALIAFRAPQLVESAYPRSGTFSSRGALGRSKMEVSGKVHLRTRPYGHSGYWEDASIAEEFSGVAAARRI